VLKSVVSRDDTIYECFPDLAQTPDGTLICVYRECMFHAPYPFSRIACRRSLDGGRTWLPKQIVDECVAEPERVEVDREWLCEDALAGYEQSRARVTEQWKIGASINCQRLICLSDGSLLMVADIHHAEGSAHAWSMLFYRSQDGGATWSGPEDPGIHDVLVPSLAELRDGRILLGASILEHDSAGQAIETQLVFCSTDRGHTWSEPVIIPSEPGQDFSEGSFVELDDGTLLGILRDDKLGRGYKVLSSDGGLTWKGPWPTKLIGLAGRPKAGVLSTGEVCITYRMDVPNEMLALHLMTQDAARVEGDLAVIPRQPMPEDKPGLDVTDPSQPWYMTSYYPGRTVVLDMDRSVHRDEGYSGWVELPNGDIYVVDYINDDAPLAHIRSYLVNRSDVILFPAGDLPWLHPSWQPFVRMSRAMAERQYLRPEGP
jgi:sialidase-1